jgi:formylglycine-generating enzyme required for sulfatase activity
MRRVSGGAFKMGSEQPVQELGEHLSAPRQVASFCMDEYEFPNQPGAQPRVNVAWLEAKSLCEELGKRLCTEAEWEKACKGPGNALFPYGNAFDGAACNTEDVGKAERKPAAAGQFARCRSGYGLADLSGNVAEWTSTSHTRDSNKEMTQKGAAFSKAEYTGRCSTRMRGELTARSPWVGFRCCAGVQQ